MCELESGEPAPQTGDYHQLDIRGRWTGRTAFMKRGEKLPPAPQGFVWQPLDERPAGELRTRASEYRSKAATAASPRMALALCEIAHLLEEMAARRTGGLGSDGPGPIEPVAVHFLTANR